MDENFYTSAQKLSKNPLGILALFLVLTYAILAIITGFGQLDGLLKTILVAYLIIFPLVVLFVFYNLVVNHHSKLYAPTDFKDDKSFLKSMELNIKSLELSKEIDKTSEKIVQNDNLGNIKEEVTKVVFKSILTIYGGLTLKVLYYDLDGRVRFRFDKEKQIVTTIFDGIEIGGYKLDSFYEDYRDLHNKGIINISSFDPFEFTIANSAKPSIKELYEDTLKEFENQKSVPMISVKKK
ncbi:hypothetical protein [Clostridium cavendishii]|nr:hypothetical protein [Clostridium cavendishii]